MRGQWSSLCSICDTDTRHTGDKVCAVPGRDSMWKSVFAEVSGAACATSDCNTDTCGTGGAICTICRLAIGSSRVDIIICRWGAGSII
ncbi:hypothetical protein DPMN_042997 [Dreissena polymorpha]|uniref:Uncharacterized protein n=1 Tax=Dreissena polymorpha TaxID=45954 RepID=A0A9D4HXE7_DREPO|nr:hypothetical protein DPMN_042997 [Dreissena polymorpha]